MKKSVIIIIAIIFVVSIALVNFLGVNPKVFNEVVYVSSISFVDENIKTNENGEKYIRLSPDENGERKYQIQYQVNPDNASNTEVRFGYDSSNGLVSIDENGLVTFARKGTVIVTITPADGSNCSDTLTINFKS